MKIISFSNQKGGVGKTTTAVNLAACLAERGKSILLIDLDPQANATSALGFESKAQCGAYNVILGNENFKNVIEPSRLENLHFVPAHMDLAGVEIELAKADDRLTRLRHILLELAAEKLFDYCLLDTPPSLGVLMTSSLCAADEIIIPLQCEYFGIEGLSKIVRLLEMLRANVNVQSKIEGILMTLYDTRTNLSKEVVNDVRKHFGDTVYQSVIPRSIRLGEAPSFGKSIIEYEPKGVGAKSYRDLADEFLRRREQNSDSKKAKEEFVAEANKA